MEDVLTSGDLSEGHDDLGTCMLVDPPETNNNTLETACLLVCGGFVPQFKSVKFRLDMAVMTLRMMSRSNCLYDSTVLVGTIIWHIEKDVVVKSHYMIGISCSHLDTLEK